MDEILANPYYSSLIVLISQITFIYLRTINVIYTAELKVRPAIISGAGIGIAWLVSMAIGADSIMKGQILPIFTFLVGGALGTYWGIRKEIKRHEKEDGYKDKSNTPIHNGDSEDGSRPKVETE